MRAVRFKYYGGPEVLEVMDVPRPSAGPGEVLVEVVSAALNPGETGIREGYFASTWPATFPEGQGNDFSGIVAEAGPGVNGFAVGQAVLGFRPRAAQAEFVALRTDSVAAKPDALGWDEAATVAGAGATAWAAVEAVKPRPGETVVVSAAAGGVGVVAAQLARLRGARVIGTAGPANHEFLTSIGVTPLEYGPGLAGRISEVTSRVDAFIDTFGAGNVDLAIALCVPVERINTNADGAAVRRYGVHAQAQEQADTPAVWSRLALLVAEGHVQVPITKTYPLERVREAYQDLATRHVRGKRVLRIMSPDREADLRS